MTNEELLAAIAASGLTTEELTGLLAFGKAKLPAMVAMAQAKQAMIDIDSAIAAEQAKQLSDQQASAARLAGLSAEKAAMEEAQMAALASL